MHSCLICPTEDSHQLGSLGCCGVRVCAPCFVLMHVGIPWNPQLLSISDNIPRYMTCTNCRRPVACTIEDISECISSRTFRPCTSPSEDQLQRKNTKCLYCNVVGGLTSRHMLLCAQRPLFTCPVASCCEFIRLGFGGFSCDMQLLSVVDVHEQHKDKYTCPLPVCRQQQQEAMSFARFSRHMQTHPHMRSNINKDAKQPLENNYNFDMFMKHMTEDLEQMNNTTMKMISLQYSDKSCSFFSKIARVVAALPLDSKQPALKQSNTLGEHMSCLVPRLPLLFAMRPRESLQDAHARLKKDEPAREIANRMARQRATSDEIQDVTLPIGTSYNFLSFVMLYVMLTACVHSDDLMEK